MFIKVTLLLLKYGEIAALPYENLKLVILLDIQAVLWRIQCALKVFVFNSWQQKFVRYFVAYLTFCQNIRRRYFD